VTNILDIPGSAFMPLALNPRYAAVVLFHAPFSTVSNDVFGIFCQVARLYFTKVDVEEPYMQTVQRDPEPDGNGTAEPRRPERILVVPPAPDGSLLFITFDLTENDPPVGTPVSGLPTILLYTGGIDGKMRPIRCEEPYTYETIRIFVEQNVREVRKRMKTVDDRTPEEEEEYQKEMLRREHDPDWQAKEMQRQMSEAEDEEAAERLRFERLQAERKAREAEEAKKAQSESKSDL
jgi:hypothetical protein